LNNKIGIVGDVHAEDKRLGLTLSWLEKQAVDTIVCTGDVADGRGDIDATCALLAGNNVRTVAGNHDRWLLTDKARHVENAHFRSAVSDCSLNYLHNLPQTLSLMTPMGELLLCHGMIDNDLAKVWPGTATTEAKRSLPLDELLAQPSSTPRFVVNGHMHFRTLIDFKNCQLINGGTLKGPYPGVTIIDLNAQELCGFDFCPDSGFLPTQCYSLSDVDARRVWSDTQEFDCNWAPVVLHRPRA
jgi:predicted phosphodiesterase